ncbi:MAG TPA: M28 family peptidase, partial [Polyangiaceae bacterium]|nr:M28 family peptidase [Polyangiaceae bacterium]
RPPVTERARTTQPWLAWGLAVLAASCVAVIAAWRLSPPGDEGTNEASFSGARALAYSAHVVGNLPHMVASPENRAVKRRLLHELGSKTATTQRGTVCGSHGSCALVENVLFRLEGANPSREIVVAAHYDSVAAGIGAGDDGSGVGILLELKRVLERQGPLPHPVTLLFTDGEELGLLGAELYARNLKDDAVERIALNVEARGTSGASLLFDLADPDAAILQRVAPALTRTFTSSLFPLVYQKLPNDTDLTALRRANIRGIGFAFIGRVDKYHTSDDDHASVSVASVHHQGRSVYEATQALLDPRPLHRVDQLEVFFDVLGFRLVQLSVAGARILALLALFVFVAGVLRARHTGALSARDLGRGVFAVVLGLALAGACGGGLEWVWRYTGALPGPFLAKQGHGYMAVLAVATLAT